MSYQNERDQFVSRMGQEGLPYPITSTLLRAATTKQRYAEMLCSSEAADRDRVLCPADTQGLQGRPRRPSGPCICNGPGDTHESVPRIAVLDARIKARLVALMPAGWALDFQGDPRGYVLRVIPPSYAERNRDRDVHNLDSIGVPARESRIRW